MPVLRYWSLLARIASSQTFAPSVPEKRKTRIGQAPLIRAGSVNVIDVAFAASVPTFWDSSHFAQSVPPSVSPHAR